MSAPAASPSKGPRACARRCGTPPPRVRDVYLTAEALARYADDIVEPARAAGLWVHEVTPEVLAAMAETDAPQGVLAVVDTATDDLDAVLDAGPRLLVLLTHVRDPGNAGTVIRGADAAGADAVLVSEASVDVHASKVVRSTAGSLFHLPVVTGLDVDGDAAAVAGARHPHATPPTVPAPRCCPTPTSSVPHCWVMGNEAWGLDDDVRDACDDVVRVPIHGRAESLNLAMAATVCLYASAGQHDPGALRPVACATCRSRSGSPTTWPSTGWSSSPTAWWPPSAPTPSCAS